MLNMYIFYVIMFLVNVKAAFPIIFNFDDVCLL